MDTVWCPGRRPRLSPIVEVYIILNDEDNWVSAATGQIRLCRKSIGVIPLAARSRATLTHGTHPSKRKIFSICEKVGVPLGGQDTFDVFKDQSQVRIVFRVPTSWFFSLSKGPSSKPHGFFGFHGLPNSRMPVFSLKKEFFGDQDCRPKVLAAMKLARKSILRTNCEHLQILKAAWPTTSSESCRA